MRAQLTQGAVEAGRGVIGCAAVSLRGEKVVGECEVYVQRGL